MIANISKASPSISKPLHYNFKKVEQGEADILLVRNLPSDLPMTEQAVSEEMERRIPTETRVRNFAFHVSLNPDPSEKVDEETYKQLAQDYMEAMGYGEQPYIVFLHRDIERMHIHIVSTRVDPLGKKIPDSNERYRSQKVVQALERKYGLLETPKRKQAEEQVRPLRRPKKVDYRSSDLRSQVADVVRFVLKYGTFRTIGELNVLLAPFNVSAEITKTDFNGKTYEGIVYVPTDDQGKKVGTPIHSNELGRGTGIHAVRYDMKKSGERVTAYLPILKAAIQDCMRGDPDLKSFARRLDRKGIQFIPRINDSGRIYGVTFLFPDKMVAINGSALGKQYSANVFNAYFKGELRGNPFVLSGEEYQAAYTHPQEAQVPHAPYQWTIPTASDLIDLSLLDSLSLITSSGESEYEAQQEEAQLQYGIRQSLRKKKKRRKDQRL